jgi:hypothetical protein
MDFIDQGSLPAARVRGVSDILNETGPRSKGKRLMHELRMNRRGFLIGSYLIWVSSDADCESGIGVLPSGGFVC